MHSAVIGEDFVIDVALPTDLSARTEPLPVIYLTDGNMMFPMVNSTLRLLQAGEDLPQALLVGIGYREAHQAMALRTRDLTPTFDPAYFELARHMGAPVPEHIRSGGADLFADFIDEEVKPFIRRHYPASDKQDTLLGDSLGGLFTLHTLFTRPSSYHRYVAGSPSLWWDNTMLFETEAAYAAANKDLNASLFISIGALEEPAEGPAQWAKMVTNMKKMTDRLRQRAYPSLQLSAYEFEGETHSSVIPATFSRGLRAVFGT
ncbi:MAG: alpha/beta hydrolase-fold protein [Pseudomonadota bacterium]